MKTFAKFIPPPKGLNLTQILVNGLPEYALKMKNLIAKPNGPETFPMAATSATASPAGVTGKTPFLHHGTEMWIAGSAGIFQFGSGVNVYVLTNGRGWATSFSVAGGPYTIFFNGVNIPAVYDGAVWAAAAWAGPTLTNLFQGLMHRGRLYLADLSGPVFWYLAAGAVGGAATSYNFGTALKKGGKLVALATLTRDGGSGTEDYLIALTSNGELLMFSGNDPGAASWNTVGVWDIGRPAAKTNREPNSFVKSGGDLWVFTENGVYSVNQIVRGRDLASLQSLSWQIDPMLRFVLRSNLLVYMQMIPTQKLLVLHLDSTTYKFVMNLETGEWSTVTSTNIPYYQDHYIEWQQSGQPTKVYGINYATTTIYELFNTDSSIAQDTVVPAFELWTQYSRLGQIEDLTGLAIRPHIYIRGSTDTWVASDNPTFTIGCAYDQSSDYNQIEYNKSTAGGRGPFVEAGHFAYDWDINNDVSPRTGRKSRGWATVPQEIGSSVSFFLKSGNSTQAKLTRFHGFDFRYSPVELMGP